MKKKQAKDFLTADQKAYHEMLLNQYHNCPRCRGSGFVDVPYDPKFSQRTVARGSCLIQLTKWEKEHGIIEDV